ncbi:PTS system mannose/fructose/sorbose family transporter subunit IID [Lactobacillus iners]|jgi:PTS system mannose/fructose/sorbose family IID component|uniref:PTS system mannose/fructose/sorbose family transporter subunit IID n=1 Tax=Lactobacillus iners TaxID=147802 RepID=UPI001F093808|nr:PTS system mannose/fructose/sorbose family transporter subunit IID [Lactobacillus iners]MCT7675214.1 PTS system mannose/fructose/sorbose family transporter subunit IID [Lactobacillus iners]MCT7685695.1 PTS system mannose/fructose/sorbose family transporter subunit IID [Lactobacillus iners]MCT7725125.1 PTS system mannose/fructose/sorbose family transporter subunit IID [Lactobacillus iners]MCT7727631.1 PTS system mannose/fructose/sorbose family transporter subunit IID [Lactobacillus iners]MCT
MSNKNSHITDENCKLTKKDLNKMFRRWIFSAGLGYNFETQQAPSVAFSMRKALRKIYKDDKEYIEAMDNHYKYFNANPLMANVILGATLAMEENEGIKAKNAVQSLKTSLMGPFSGVGDSIFWILIPTIMGSIAGYMAVQGNATGAVIWMILQAIFYFLKVWLFKTGYNSGTKLVTSLGKKINIFTDAISIMGLMVIGCLIPTVVKVFIPLKFKTGKVILSLQNGILDKIMPALLPVAVTIFVYWLLGKKNITPTKIIGLIILICLLGSFTGILGVVK